MSTIDVVSSVYGGYDADLPHRDDFSTTPADFVVVTDGDLPAADLVEFRAVIERRPHLHPRYAAKIAKCRPDRYTAADIVIWVDGSFRWAPGGLDRLVEHVAANPAPRHQFAHPDRTTIADERDASTWMLKYAGQPIAEQVAYYLDCGHIDNELWATGLIVYDRNWLGQGDLVTFGNAWLVEQARWSYQDQISLPWVRQTARARIEPLPGNLRLNDYGTWAPHTRDD